MRSRPPSAHAPTVYDPQFVPTPTTGCICTCNCSAMLVIASLIPPAPFSFGKMCTATHQEALLLLTESIWFRLPDNVISKSLFKHWIEIFNEPFFLFIWAWIWEYEKTGGRSSQLHVWVWQQMLTVFSYFLFLFSAADLLTRILGQNVKLGGPEDIGKKKKERGKIC